ncbi:MAG: hypothetical protein HAW66_05710 [Shewanella sp.]|nr:hypothetical protein [Shewanella sp.]
MAINETKIDVARTEPNQPFRTVLIPAEVRHMSLECGEKYEIKLGADNALGSLESMESNTGRPYERCDKSVNQFLTASMKPEIQSSLSQERLVVRSTPTPVAPRSVLLLVGPTPKDEASLRNKTHPRAPMWKRPDRLEPPSRSDWKREEKVLDERTSEEVFGLLLEHADNWKPLVEELGLTSEKIEIIDKRYCSNENRLNNAITEILKDRLFTKNEFLDALIEFFTRDITDKKQKRVFINLSFSNWEDMYCNLFWPKGMDVSNSR